VGLVPYWAKDIKVGFANINAMAETIDTKPAFREAFQRRRCLVPVDNFLRMEKDRHRKAALRDSIGQPAADGVGGIMGKLAFAGRRMGAQFRDHHDEAQ
jgi:putative SOS response-associated peptidase YedK